MSNELEEWVTSAVDAFHLRLVRSKEDKSLLEQQTDKATAEKVTGVFHPHLLYFIFGDEELIFGYKGLKVDLFYASGSLRSYLNIHFDEKLEIDEEQLFGPDAKRVKLDESKREDDSEDEDGENGAAEDTEKPDLIPNIKEKLDEYLPDSYTTSLAEFSGWVEHDARAFKPVGNIIARYVPKKNHSTVPSTWETFSADNIPSPSYEFTDDADLDVSYELFHTHWDTPGYHEFHARMEFFTPMSIECATYLDDKDLRWEFINLFEKRKRPDGSFSYHWVGFASLYGFLYYPDMLRMRVAQFLIALPHAHRRHGLAFYDAIFHYLLNVRRDVREIVFEDPSDIMDEIRDRVEFMHLLSDPEFRAAVTIPPSKDALARLKTQSKIASRQFDRLVDMGILTCNDLSRPENDKAFRLWSKERLYKVNHEILVQMEKEEIKESLQRTFEGVLSDYKRLVNTALK